MSEFSNWVEQVRFENRPWIVRCAILDVRQTRKDWEEHSRLWGKARWIMLGVWMLVALDVMLTLTLLVEELWPHLR